jgi:hypothetical protein
MRLRTTVIGALNVFCARPIALTEEDLRIAQALADIATIGILQERAISDARTVSSQLEAALQSGRHRQVLGQAKGIVAEHNGINVDARCPDAGLRPGTIGCSSKPLGTSSPASSRRPRSKPPADGPGPPANQQLSPRFG